jgi:sRNA-binding protein
MAQSRRFAEAYAAGAQATPAGSLTQYTDWSQDRTTERSLQGATQLYSTVTQARSAWNALEGAQDAATRRDAVAGVGGGPANTEQIDWAR